MPKNTEYICEHCGKKVEMRSLSALPAGWLELKHKPDPAIYGGIEERSYPFCFWACLCMWLLGRMNTRQIILTEVEVRKGGSQ